MSHISFGQFVIILLLGFLLFGDISSLIKNMKIFIKTLNLNKMFIKKKYRKKGS